MAENKIVATQASLSAFLAKVKDPQRRADCVTLVRIMEEVTGEKAALWGNGVVGFGTCHYKYASGREGDMALASFSPRPQNLTIYIATGFGREGDWSAEHHDLLAKLGKFKSSKACLYIKRLDDVHPPTLKKLLADSVKAMRQRYA